MKRLVTLLLSCSASVLVALLPSSSGASEVSADQMIDRAETILWGRTMQGEFEMVVTTPNWERKLMLRAWMDRPTLSFLRILEPAKERGIASLRIASEMWNFIPKIERTVKVPPSMMLQPWFGSDFTNDDLVKEGSFVADYTHRLIGEREIRAIPAYSIELKPKPEAAVVWGKVIYSVRKADNVPLQIEYYDEQERLVRVLNYSNFRVLGGRTIPVTWEMRPVDKPGKKTTITVKQVEYDRPVDKDTFTMRNLSRRNTANL